MSRFLQRALWVALSLLQPRVFAHPVQVPYFNDFSDDGAADFFAPSGNGYNWGWDWRTDHYESWIAAGNRAASSTVQVKALSGGVPLTMTATFDPVLMVGSNTIGFGVLGGDDDFSGGGSSGYYLADVNPNSNQIRVVRVNAGNTFIGPQRTIQGMDITDLEPFELEVSVSYPVGQVQIDFTVRRGAVSDTLIAVDSNILTGSWFGFRLRTAGASSDLEVIMDDFSLRPTHVVTVTNTPPTVALVSESYDYIPESNDATASAIQIPSWMSVVSNGVSGTPTPGDVGTHLVDLLLDTGTAQLNLHYVVSVPAITNPVISEFMADNELGLLDEDGDSSDWIEVFNPTASSFDLSGWHLSDDAAALTRWTFPVGTVVPPRSFLLLFASGKTNYAHHADFRLNDRAGESIYLVRPDLHIVHAVTNAPKQEPDHSFGLVGDYTRAGFFIEPTPGAANATNAYEGFVADTSFSIDRGFYETAQQVAISCVTPGAEIRYTTDGSTPTESTGSVVTGLVTIAETTVLRARAFREGFVPSDTDTQSYLFVDDILVQQQNGAAPPGWPSGSVNGQVFQYGMDPEVYAQHSLAEMRAAMTNIPTFSLVTDQANFSDAEIGIYANAENRGPDWERPVSVEMIDPATGEVQIDGGFRIRGGFSRQDSNAKHAFHLYFRNRYGDSELKYPLFDAEGTDRFKRLDLRATQGRSWHYSHTTAATFNRDVFGREIQRDMGQPYSRSRHVHLLINGIYWGVFQTQERVDRHYAESYFGGNDEDYDVMKTRTRSHRVEAVDGTPDTWTALYDAAVIGFADDADYLAVQSLVDIDNLIDYMLAIFFTGSTDGPVSLGANVPKNFFALRPKDGRFGYRFFVHDNEDTLQSVNQNTTVNNNTGSRLTHFNPKWLHQRLMTNPQYVRRFGDRTHRYFFNDGLLTTAPSVARFQGSAERLNEAIIGESLRWGDARRSTPYTRSDWVGAVNGITGSFLVQRPGIVLNQLASQGLYPSVDAPVFSQHGGSISPGFGLAMTAPSGVIHFTTDGMSDPADPGAEVYTTALSLTNAETIVRARVFDNGTWSALTEARFVAAVPARANHLAITEVHYNPLGDDETEFIEITNISTQRVDLSNCRLVDAVLLTFDPLLLEPGARAVVVENQSAFTNAYGTNVTIVGQWSGGLANDQDTITLNDAAGLLIDQVAYDQDLPWPEPADGDGYSLVRIGAGTSPADWRSSAVPGGNPGSSDALDFASWQIDHPGDSLETYLFADQPSLVITRDQRVQVTRRIAADDYQFVPELSTNQQDWVSAALLGSVEVSRENMGNGLQHRVWQLPAQLTSTWFRIRAVLR